MLRAIGIALIVGVLVVLGLWALGWIPENGQICEVTNGTEKCESHNIFFASTWNFAKAIDHWSVLITAIATIVIAVFTATLATISKTQIGHGRQVERAYLTSGGPGQDVFQLDVGNYGKTPAYLTEYAVEICDAREIGMVPKYLMPDYKRDTYIDRIPAGAHKSIALKKQPMGLANPVVYGRVWYEDIWKETHYFSFILAMTPKNNHPDLSKAGLKSVPKAYTDWD